MVAAGVLKESTWTVLSLILEIELFTQEHYRQTIEPDENPSPLYKDIFFFHMEEETTHALMDELQWPQEDKKLTPTERDQAVDQLIDLVAEIDRLLQAQSEADVDYFLKVGKSALGKEETDRIRDGVLKAYRYQYIFSGVGHPRFQKRFSELTTEEQQQRVPQALSPLM